MADLLVLPRTAKSLQNGVDFSKNILGQPKRKKRPQCHKESSWQVRRSRICQKEKEQSHLSRSPDPKVGESQSEQEPHLGEREGIRAGAWGRKGGLHSEERQVPRRRGWASKEKLPRESRERHQRVSGRKSSPSRSAESWFHSKSDQT